MIGGRCKNCGDWLIGYVSGKYCSDGCQRRVYRGPTPLQTGSGQTPLDTVPLVDTAAPNRYRYNTIALGGFNFVLLKTAQLVDLGPMSQLVSRVVAYHFDKYWETSYLPQLEFDEMNTLPPRKDHAGMD